MALKERVEEAKRIALQEIKVSSTQIQGSADGMTSDEPRPPGPDANMILTNLIQEEELKRKNKRKFASEDNESAVKNKIGKIQHKKKGKGRR